LYAPTGVAVETGGVTEEGDVPHATKVIHVIAARNSFIRALQEFAVPARPIVMARYCDSVILRQLPE
jgi:hypothetical protein